MPQPLPQYTTNIVDKKAITSISILNNIIPHMTGISHVYSVLPELKRLVNGTSLRVPVSNGSLLDINIQFANNQVVLADVIELVKSNELYKIVYDINDKNHVSCDFMTTTTPTILDKSSSIDIGG